MKYLVKKHGRTLSKHNKISSAKKNLCSGCYIVKRKRLMRRDK